MKIRRATPPSLSRNVWPNTVFQRFPGHPTARIPLPLTFFSFLDSNGLRKDDTSHSRGRHEKVKVYFGFYVWGSFPWLTKCPDILCWSRRVQFWSLLSGCTDILNEFLFYTFNSTAFRTGPVCCRMYFQIVFLFMINELNSRKLSVLHLRYTLK